jgi:hypothetical protein
MTLRDDEIAFAGNRELIERELARSVAQVLHLMPGPAAGHRPLQEIGVDIVLSVAFLRAARGAEPMFAADLAGACDPGSPPRHPTPDGVPEDIAADYLRAKTELQAILRRDIPIPDFAGDLW